MKLWRAIAAYFRRRAELRQRRRWDDAFWADIVRFYSKANAVIDGVCFHVVGEEIGGFRGHEGALFVIVHHDGRRTTTTNLWCRGKVPARWRSKLPDDATFDP